MPAHAGATMWPVLSGLVTVFLAAASSRAEPLASAAGTDLQAVAVNVHRTPVQSWPGYGIYLSDGLVITAAHVAGHGFLTQPKIVFAGKELPTAVVKEGSYPDDDLTVLKIDGPVPPELANRHTVLCAWSPRPGEPVVVSTPEALTTSKIVAPQVLPPDMRVKYAASIADVYTTGNSGSGVFDAGERCLLGIMSSKIEQNLQLIVNGQHVTRTIGLAKHFVPSTDIQTFLNGIP